MSRLNRIIPFLITACLGLSLFGGCGSSKDAAVITEESPSPSPSPSATPEPTPEPDPYEGMVESRLTGLYIDEESSTRRPVAVVINNINRALPQSGIRQADLYYEVLAEGGITRIIAIFQDFNSEKIGPIRSARHYFLDFALNHDAIFVHHGGSQEEGVANAYTAIRNYGVNNLDGMSLEGTVFWRDPQRNSQPGMKEHSSYTSAEHIMEGIEKANYRAELKEDAEGPFLFYDEPTVPSNGEKAILITVPFAGSQKAVFSYDDKLGLYWREQNGNPHIDEETFEQLTVTNVIIQRASVYSIAGDEAGRQDAVLTGSGDGWLCTQGEVVPLTWKKSSHQSPTEWFDANGTPLMLNKGKTWICVFQTTGHIEFENGETEDDDELES